MPAYCSQCGSKSVAQPGVTIRFCQSCGFDFIKGAVQTVIKATPTPQRQSFKPKNRYQAEEEDSDELEFPDGLPELRASDVIIEGNTAKSRFEKIGELSKFPEIDGPRVKNPQEITAEAFKASWQKDAGSSRNRVSVEIGE